MSGGVTTYEGKKCKTKADKLVDELYVQQNFSSNGMLRVPYLLKMYERIDCSEESPIQPSSSLGYELRNSICVEVPLALPPLELFNHLPGTSVSPVALLTYFSTQCSPLLATNSQQRIRSSARYMFAVKTSAS